MTEYGKNDIILKITKKGGDLILKKVFETILEIIFLLSLVLLGKFEGNISHNAMLGSYQLVVTLFWISGVLRYGLLNNDVKTFMYNAIKALITAISVIPLWYFISGQIQNGVFEPISTIAHFSALIVILKLIKKGENLSGRIVYYTHAAIPIITLILIRLGVPIIYSVIMGVLLPEPVNYYYYKRKAAHN